MLIRQRCRLYGALYFTPPRDPTQSTHPPNPLTAPQCCASLWRVIKCQFYFSLHLVHYSGTKVNGAALVFKGCINFDCPTLYTDFCIWHLVFVMSVTIWYLLNRCQKTNAKDTSGKSLNKEFPANFGSCFVDIFNIRTMSYQWSICLKSSFGFSNKMHFNFD